MPHQDRTDFMNGETLTFWLIQQIDTSGKTVKDTVHQIMINMAESETKQNTKIYH